MRESNADDLRLRSDIEEADGAGGLPGSLAGWAVFLDVDGTLLDLAATPDSIVVPVDLRDDLVAVSKKIDGALALVTGRPIAFVDGTFPGHRFCVAGLHGAEWRDASGAIAGVQAGDDFGLARERLKEAARDWPGVIIEDKGTAIAAHFRNATHLEGQVRTFMDGLAESLGAGWMLQKGKCVYEVRPGGRDKGEAVRTFMAGAPFAGRRPLVVGDDITDEAMFHYANGAGGLSVRVGLPAGPSEARLVVEAPATVRRWLGEMAA
jgi:trehalose 6-phosphate phosphatase